MIAAPVTRFVEDCVEVREGAVLDALEAHRAYRAWRAPYDALGVRDFFLALDRAGVALRVVEDTWFADGVRLSEPGLFYVSWAGQGVAR